MGEAAACRVACAGHRVQCACSVRAAFMSYACPLRCTQCACSAQCAPSLSARACSASYSARHAANVSAVTRVTPTWNALSAELARHEPSGPAGPLRRSRRRPLLWLCASSSSSSSSPPCAASAAAAASACCRFIIWECMSAISGSLFSCSHSCIFSASMYTIALPSRSSFSASRRTSSSSSVTCSSLIPLTLLTWSTGGVSG